MAKSQNSILDICVALALKWPLARRYLIPAAIFGTALHMSCWAYAIFADTKASELLIMISMPISFLPVAILWLAWVANSSFHPETGTLVRPEGAIGRLPDPLRIGIQNVGAFAYWMAAATVLASIGFMLYSLQLSAA